MLKLCGILRSSAILESDSPQSSNRKDYSLWVTPFIPHERPNVKQAITGYLRLPQPTSAPALMRVLHWLRCWAEEPGYDTSAQRLWPDTRRLQLPLDDCCRLVLPYNAVHSINRRNRSLMTLPGWGRKVLLLAIIPVPRTCRAYTWNILYTWVGLISKYVLYLENCTIIHVHMKIISKWMQTQIYTCTCPLVILILLSIILVSGRFMFLYEHHENHIISDVYPVMIRCFIFRSLSIAFGRGTEVLDYYVRMIIQSWWGGGGWYLIM